MRHDHALRDLADPGEQDAINATAAAVPRVSASRKPGIEPGAIPEKVSLSTRMTVTAELAKLVDEVK